MADGASGTKLRWGILGSGMIAKRFAKAIVESQTGELSAVGSRSQASADAFGAEFGVEKCYEGYDTLLADGDIDAVYIALPHTLHPRWTVRAADAGKHILCEKPAAMNSSELMVMLEACRRNGVFFVEAFMWRSHPGAKKLVELIQSGLIGDVQMIDTRFSFNLDGQPEHTRMQNELAGGGILDVGCYCLSAARLIAGAAVGRDFVNPSEIKAVAHIGSTGVDEISTATCKFELPGRGPILANMMTGVQCETEMGVYVWGSKGKLHLPSPWFNDGRILVTVYGEKEKEVLATTDEDLYVHEIDELGRCVAEGRREAHPPALTWDDTRGQQAAVDAWRHAVGLKFAPEDKDALTQTVSGHPLQVRPEYAGHVTRETIEGLDKPVSQVVMGTMAFDVNNMPYAAVMLDDFFERGGNAFDTAKEYGPHTEQALGQWVKLRGVRDQVVIIGKGAHTARHPRWDGRPGCDPLTLTEELHQSLERMQTDYVDIYCMHRDNRDIPVGEFVDVLNEHVDAGRMKIFGGSNWSIERFEEANAYAKKNGKRGFTLLSNNLSLAQWSEPMWEDCQSMSDAKSRQWLKDTGTPMMAWSSQASGFFLPVFQREVLDSDWGREVARVWYNDGNFERKARVEKMAGERGVTPIQIALAYVLCQPMQVFALIGPRTIEETRTSLQAFDVKLSAEDLAWLNLES